MRALSPALDRNLSNPAAARVFIMAFLDLETRPMYVHNDIGVVRHEERDYYGVGELGEVSPVIEDGQIAPGRFQLALNGLNPTWIADARAERHIGRRAVIYVASRDLATGAFDGEPEVLVDGVMQQMQMSVGATDATINLRIEDSRSLFRRNPGQWFANDAHQAENPGDTCFALMDEATKVSFTWGERGRNPYGAGRTNYGGYGFDFSGFGR